MKKERFLLVTERDYLDVVMNLIEHARESIDILAYSFAIGSEKGKLAYSGAPYLIAAKLAEAVKKKRLNVRLYIEGERETSSRNAITAKFLKKAGVKVRFGATHAKGFMFDGRYVLFGSTNLTNQSVMKNNETNILIDDDAARAGFAAYFEHLWEGGGHGGIELDPPMLADGAFKDALIEMIDGAKKSVDFSIYFFHHGELEKALLRAHDRGVKVTGFVHNHFAFAMSYVRRTRGTVARLFEGGIRNLYYGPTHLFTHSKYLIRDRRELALGTGNWLHEDVKVHPQLYIRLDEPSLAGRLASHLKRQIRASGKKYKP